MNLQQTPEGACCIKLKYNFIQFLSMFSYKNTHVSVVFIIGIKLIVLNRQCWFHLTTTMRTYLDFKVVGNLFVISTCDDRWR